MKIVFATNNPNKLAEIRQLMPEGIEILSLKDINCLQELPETSETLEDNAAQKLITYTITTAIIVFLTILV